MNTPPGLYRVALYNGPLRREDLSIMYTHVGGGACLPTAFQAPDLVCPGCGQDLIPMVQYVLPDSTDDLHRVLYLFSCDSAHFTEHLRIMTVNIPISKSVTEVTEVEPQVEDSVIRDASGKEVINLLGGEVADTTTLLSLIKEGSNPSSAREANAKAKAREAEKEHAKDKEAGTMAKRDGPIPFTLRQGPLRPYDVFSKPMSLEDEQEEGDNDEDEDDDDEETAQLTPMEVIQRQYPKAILLYGYDAPPMLTEPFLKTLPDAKELVHVVDVFPTIISLLKLADNDDSTTRNGVEFRSISIWSTRSTTPGYHEGFAIVVPEEDLKLSATEMKAQTTKIHTKS
ncbi:hypothetical protein GMRT_13293 [Giardia muris]|uniref:Programmed cell death protein 2 C-terminal domain-containing protein n=1 Tax=Giardia muris TaxID=5742 RepID=A0A4Z1T020_GIAMU|nr:hypothetical protein GMRT_13293 [Giardia muris]|eukprot:TNJ26257.1 hypothetical protein GMRT_13293 [Giardia muris]